MGTRFELAACGEDPTRLGAALEGAIAEVESAEAALSLFEPSSQVSQVNAAAGRAAVSVDGEVFALLRACREWWQLTDGAFDITVGPLMYAYGFRGQAALPADSSGWAEVRRTVGMDCLGLEESSSAVRFLRPGMSIDLGGVGKGFALERAGNVLVEAGVQRGFLHAGTSSVLALGAPEGAVGWEVLLPGPAGARQRLSALDLSLGGASATGAILARLRLRDEALSVSAVWGRVVDGGSGEVGHLMDPKRGVPAGGAWMSAVIGRSAVEVEAFSTALVVGGRALQERLRERRPDLQTLLVCPGPGPGEWSPFTVGMNGRF